MNVVRCSKLPFHEGSVKYVPERLGETETRTQAVRLLGKIRLLPLSNFLDLVTIVNVQSSENVWLTPPCDLSASHYRNHRAGLSRVCGGVR